MAFRTITIMFVPDGAKRVRQLKVPMTLCAVVACAFLFAATLFTWLTWNYGAMRAESFRVSEIRKENEGQKVHLVALAQKIDRISAKLHALRELDLKLRTMLDLQTDEETGPILGIGGSDMSIMLDDYTVEKAHRKLVKLLHQSVEDLDTEASIRAIEKAQLREYIEEQKSVLAHTPSVWPAKGWVSSRFGYRISPFTHEKEFHKGLDISSRVGSPIIAPADGVVTMHGWDHGYGKVVTINHGYGYRTVYGHLSKILVKKGQRIKRGQKIALLGNTGRSTGPHLHYEVHVNSVPVDPQRYILN